MSEALSAPARRRIVLVSGAPATGKTTLAGPLAAALGYPLLAKDHIKETLFDALRGSASGAGAAADEAPDTAAPEAAPGTAVPGAATATAGPERVADSLAVPPADPLTDPLAESRRIGAAAMALLWSLGARCPQAVLEANFQADHPATRPALEALDADVVEVHCRCPAEEAARRFRERAPAAHKVHVFREVPAEVSALSERPLGYGPVIVVDTTRPVRVPALVAEIRRLFETLRSRQ